MSWIKPITDRTIEDVNTVVTLNSVVLSGDADETQISLWKQSLKGAFNVSDMQRLFEDMNYLADVANVTLNLPQPTLLPTTEWFSKLLQNLEVLLEYYGVFDSTPSVPKTPMNTYTKFNDFEQILADMYLILQNVFYHYCSEDGFYCGSEIGMLL